MSEIVPLDYEKHPAQLVRPGVNSISHDAREKEC